MDLVWSRLILFARLFGTSVNDFKIGQDYEYSLFRALLTKFNYLILKFSYGNRIVCATIC